MWLCFVDEFGDFSAKFDLAGRSVENYSSWRPVCGYGGFLIPSAHYKAFCDHFARLRMIGIRNIAFAKHNSVLNADRRISFEEFALLFSQQRHRLYSKSEEVGGTDFFSGSYLNSSNHAGSRRREVIRRAKKFLSLVEQFDGEIFFSGIEKQGYLARPRNKARPRSLHVNLMPRVLRIAHDEAVARKSQIKMIFDHHPEDDETMARIRAKQERKQVHAIAALQTRQEYSQEIIVRERFFDYLKEPMFHVQSHWSLGIQAADWICSLLGKVKSYESDSIKFDSYEVLGKKLGDRIEDLRSPFSAIEFSSAQNTRLSRQLKLNFGRPTNLNG
jgi:hypothetical protein